MKILLVVPEYPPYSIGGGGEVFKNLAENYRKLGHDVVVIYGYYPTKSWWEDIKEYTDENGIFFYQIPEIPCPKSKPFLRTAMPPNLKVWLKLKQIIQKEKPEVAHLHGYGLIFINSLSNILYSLKIRYVYTLHGAPVSPAEMKGFMRFGYFCYKKIFGHKTLENASAITAVSEYSITFSEFNEYKNNIIVVNNGIDCNKFKQHSQQGNIYEDYLNKDQESIICLSLGRIEWLKGFQYFIESIPGLLEDGFNIKYFIAGKDNGYKNELNRLIKKYNIENNVYFLDYLNFEQKLNALANCNYVIVPSIVENFPAVPLEAMAMKKIPIVNNAGGLPEIVKNNYNGLILDFKNKEIFSDAFKNFLRNSSLQSNIQQNLSAVEKYDWEEVVKSYIIIFNSHKLERYGTGDKKD